MIGFVRRFYLLILLILAFVVPYALLGDSTGSIRDKISGLFTGSSDDVDPVEGIDDPEVGRLLALQRQLAQPGAIADAPAALTPVVRLENVLRFDVNPRWVAQYWPHVSTTRIDGSLDGMRVPIITGTNPQDMVASLTYYFNAQQQVQRIAMDGTTGDDRQLVGITTRVFQLKPEPQAGVGIYVSRWSGKPISALWIRRLPIAGSGPGSTQYEFSLELNRPSNYHGLSTRLQQRLQNAHATGPQPNISR